MSKWMSKHKVISAVLGAFLALTMGYAIALVTVQSLTGEAGGKTKAVVVASPTFVEVSAGEIQGTISPGQTGALTFKVTNPNTGALTWTDVTCASLPCDADFTIEVTGADGACGSQQFTFIPRTGLTVNIPGSATTVVSVPGAISMAAGAGIGCNNAIVEAVGLRATFTSA